MIDYRSKKEGLNQIVDLFMTTFQKYCQLDKQPMNLGQGIKLYHAELHTISDIGNKPEINITELAAHQNVTKGAVSQIVNKLVKKQYVAKFKGDNEKEIKLRLTDKGMNIFNIKQEYQNQVFKQYEEIFDNTTERDHNLIKKILRTIIENIDCKFK